MKSDRHRSIEKPVVVAVEGLDYFYLLLSQIRDKAEFREVQLWNLDESEQFRDQVAALMSGRHFKENPGVRALGFIRDAESNRTSRDDQVRTALSVLGLPTPRVPMSIAEGSPKTGYLLMPHDADSGCLEHACLKASRFPDRLQCAEAFLDCVSKTYSKTTNQNHQAKLKVHAMIAADDKKPAMTLGESASAGLWDFTQPSLKVMLEFIEMMVRA